MESSLCWKTEEEGSLLVTGEQAELHFLVYRVGEEEAELKLQEILPKGTSQAAEQFWWKTTGEQAEETENEIQEGMTQAFWELWEEGFEEVLLVEKKGSAVECILAASSVVCYSYSEYMMQKDLPKEQNRTETVAGKQRLLFTTEEGESTVRNETADFFCRLQPYQRGYYLYEVEVEETKRNQGIATECITELLELLAAEQAERVYLQVGSYNEPAWHLYKKLGFIVTEELCYYSAVQE